MLRDFSTKDLFQMIYPLFFEQLLVLCVGIADTLIISFAGEAAVSGVSLVNQFNTIFLYLFTAMAAGGAVVISQYIGRNDINQASKSASQLLMVSTLFSIVLSIFVLFGSEKIIHFMFGKVETDVFDSCITYIKISALSYPFISIYNAGAALYRSLGKTKVTMFVSIGSNIVNVIGNSIGVFVLKAGVAGVAWPSLIARVFSAVMITILCVKQNNIVTYYVKWIFSWHSKLLKSILDVAIPNGLEHGIFQLVKVALSSIVALFGTYQIAANGIAQTMWSLAAICGATMSPIYITVIGQFMGAGDIEKVKFYFKKLSKMTFVFSFIWNAFVLLMVPIFLRFYALSEETKHLIFLLVLIHNTFNCCVYPFSGVLSSGLRATGDVKYTMYVFIFTSVFVRLPLSYIFAIYFNMGVIGIATAMVVDWFVKAILFILRIRSGKWLTFSVIKE